MWCSPYPNDAAVLKGTCRSFESVTWTNTMEKKLIRCGRDERLSNRIFVRSVLLNYESVTGRLRGRGE
jgi:hypothetical protein